MRFAAWIAIACALAAAPLPAAADKLQVVASFSVIADFAANVGGERIDLTTLVGPDGDVHVYQPSPADAASLAKAEVVLVNGLGFEGFLQRLIEASATRATIAALAEGVRPIAVGDGAQEAEPVGHEHGAVDPHAFQSAENALIYVENVAAAFCAADPEGCGFYMANAAAYSGKLTALDAELKAAVASIPRGKRTVVTSHDAFGYFGRAYGLNFLAPEGISTDSEPSARDIAALVRQVGRHGVSAVFVENMMDDRLMRQVASEAGLGLGGTLYSDALSGPSGPAATYLEMMRHNMGAITEAILGG